MIVGDYSKRSITSYVRELRFVAEYFPDVPINHLHEEHITNHMLYLKQSLGYNRDKCRMAASTLRFYLCTRRGTLSILNALGLIHLHAQFASTAA